MTTRKELEEQITRLQAQIHALTNGFPLEALLDQWSTFSFEMDIPGWDEMSDILDQNPDARAAYNALKTILGPYMFARIYPHEVAKAELRKRRDEDGTAIP